MWRLTQTNVQNGSGVDLRKTFYGYQSGTGSLLSKEYWLNGGTNPKVEMTYDAYGNPTILEDARDKQTQTEYDATTKTYPVRVTYPTTGGVQHIVKYENYDFRFGKPTVTKDENDNPTTYSFDVFGRVTQISYPDGGVVTKEYHDDVFPRYVVTKVKENASGQTIDKYDYVDGLGRPIQTITFGEGGKSIVTKQSYDEMGRNDFAEGPFFSTGVGYPKSPPTQYPWVQRLFDYRGRPVEVRSPGIYAKCLMESGAKYFQTVQGTHRRSRQERRVHPRHDCSIKVSYLAQGSW